MADEFKAKGNAALQAGNFDEAIAMYTSAIELDGSNHVFYSNRSAAHLSKGDAEAALADATQCISVNDKWPKGYSRKGAALHALRRYDDAMDTYEEGLKLAPEDQGLKRGLDEVSQAAMASVTPPGGGGGGGMGGLGGLFNFGGDTMAKLAGHPKFSAYLKDPEFMAKLSSLQQNPNNLTSAMSDPRIMECLSFMLQAGGGMGGMGGMEGMGGGMGGMGGMGGQAEAPPQAPQESKMEVEEEVEEEEDDSELTEEEKAEKAALKLAKKEAIEAKKKGNEHYVKKELDLALECYEQAIEKDPSNMTFLNNKAAVFFEKKDFDKCVEVCEEAVTVGRAHRAEYTDVAKAFVRAGKAKLKQGEHKDGIDFLERAQMEVFSKDIERLIKTTQLEQRKAAALAYIDPEKAVENKEKGNEFFRAQKWGEAIAEYEEAIKRDPHSAPLRNNLAAALCKVMDFNGAKSAVEKSLELDPKYVKAWARKGDIELLMKEYHKAMESYKTGLQHDASNQLCKEGLQKTMIKIQSASGSSEVDEERVAHARADPEIQAILSDPMVRQVLSDPSEAAKAMNDPLMRSKIEKLIAAGIVQTR